MLPPPIIVFLLPSSASTANSLAPRRVQVELVISIPISGSPGLGLQAPRLELPFFTSEPPFLGSEFSFLKAELSFL